jgi:hypothetical protein
MIHNFIKIQMIVIFCMSCLLGPTWAGSPAPTLNPQLSYVTQNFGLQIKSKSQLQRVLFNNDVFKLSQNKNLSDVYVLDKNGQVMNAALLKMTSPNHNIFQTSVELKPITIQGRTSQSFEGMKVKITEKNNKTVAHLVSPTGAQTPLSGAELDMGVLFDTRSVSSNLEAFLFQVVLPEQQAVHFNLQISPDLKHWQTIADTVLYQNQDVGLLESKNEQAQLTRLDLESVQLKNQYLRLSWTNNNGVPVPVVFKKANLELTSIKTTETINTAELSVFKDVTRHVWVVQNPYGASASGIRLSSVPGVASMKMQVMGQRKDTLVWHQLGNITLLAQNTKQQNQLLHEIRFAPDVYQEFKIEPLDLSNETLINPKVEVIFTPMQLIFASTGQEPYVLTVGPSHRHSFNNIKALMPQYTPGAENNIPLAEIEIPSPVQPHAEEVAETAEKPFNFNFPITGWILLLLTFLTMGWMAFSQMKQSN